MLSYYVRLTSIQFMWTISTMRRQCYQLPVSVSQYNMLYTFTLLNVHIEPVYNAVNTYVHRMWWQIIMQRLRKPTHGIVYCAFDVHVCVFFSQTRNTLGRQLSYIDYMHLQKEEVKRV